jgi:hypothetical protein
MSEELKRMIKSYIVAQGFTLEKLSVELNKKYGMKESKANLSNKLRRGSLKYTEVVKILNTLGYEINITKK